MELISPFTIDKRDMAYKSKMVRDALMPSKDLQRAPGPGHYNPGMSTGLILKGTNSAGFGGLAPRDTLLLRDVAVNPFKDPTHRKSPSPQKY